MKKLSIIILATCLFPLLFQQCSEQQLKEARVAEKLYVDLLEQLYLGQLPAAQLAETNLGLQLQQLEQGMPPLHLMPPSDYSFHLNQAATAYSDVKWALEQKNMVAAKIQLDRATYEIAAADITSFQALYVGSCYDFFASWQEVNTIVNDQMLCLMEWKEFSWWNDLAQREWASIRSHSPRHDLYHWQQAEWTAFWQARAKLDQALVLFTQNLQQGDQCLSQVDALSVNEALWELLRLFGTPSKQVELVN